jgi:hypothetical protein
VPFEAERPFRNLGLRLVRAGGGPGGAATAVQEVELAMQEHSGTEGFARVLRPTTL